MHDERAEPEPELTHACYQDEQFGQIADGTSTEQRQLLVTEWFLATLAGQFTRREKETVRPVLP